MTIERKVGMGIAGQPSGSTDVAEVFSTDFYDGSSSSQTINNGIDLAGEGGMVWQKLRVHPTPPDGQDHYLRDTVRGGGHRLYSNKTNAESGDDGGMSPNSNGFSIGSGTAGSLNGAKYVSWTFRKKKKFFDIVTYTGNGVAGREIPHGLGGPVGMMTIKQRNGTTGWATWHKGANSGNAYLELNEPDAQNTNGKFFWGNNTSYIAPTSTEFTVATDTVVNDNGQTYVAYLFADNSSEDAEDQMIKCGSYTGNGSATGPVVNLGWEPQFVLVKCSSNAASWMMMDTMRGMPTGGNTNTIRAESANSELTGDPFCEVTSTGFRPVGGDGRTNANNYTYIYMAIRAPMMKKPEAATDVFKVDNGNGSDVPAFNSGFPVDMAFWSGTGGGDTKISSRLTGGQYLETNSSGLKQADSSYAFDYQSGWYSSALAATNYAWMWKRAKGYMDCVAYSGDRSSGSRTVAHSLGVVPEMIWVKATSLAQNWSVYTAATGGTKYGWLNANNVFGTSAGYFNNTNPTDSVFTVGNDSATNATGYPYIAYLFATLDGISKCGSYTGNGSYQTIPCGFSAGSRFILIRRTDAAGSDWYVWDSVRGISAGNDPHLSLNTNAAQVTNDDSIDPANSGFIVNQVSATNINVSSGTYIFYAIA